MPWTQPRRLVCKVGAGWRLQTAWWAFKWPCAKTANALQPGCRMQACDVCTWQAPVSWGTCGATDCAWKAAAGHPGPGQLGMLMQGRACAWAANAMQPGPNEVGMQLRLRRMRRSGHMRCDRGSSRLACLCSDEVGTHLHLTRASSKALLEQYKTGMGATAVRPMRLRPVPEK